MTIQEVYEKFKHLDQSLSDKEWLKQGDILDRILYELWQAIKEEGENNSTERPRIVCLCGSTRFGDVFREANLQETCAGKIILSVGCDLRSDNELWSDEKIRQEFKVKLDELHLRKIDLADEVLVLNVGGYIGPSTKKELLLP